MSNSAALQQLKDGFKSSALAIFSIGVWTSNPVDRGTVDVEETMLNVTHDRYERVLTGIAHDNIPYDRTIYSAQYDYRGPFPERLSVSFADVTRITYYEFGPDKQKVNLWSNQGNLLGSFLITYSTVEQHKEMEPLSALLTICPNVP
jgi:hypothetical protein